MNSEAILFGKNLRKVRKSRNLTLEKFAEISYISAASISNFERGAFSPTMEEMIMLANSLGVNLKDLYPFYTPDSSNNDNNDIQQPVSN